MSEAYRQWARLNEARTVERLEQANQQSLYEAFMAGCHEGYLKAKREEDKRAAKEQDK